MNYQYTPFLWPLLFSTAITAFLGVYALIRRRKSKGTISFVLSMAVLSVWALFNALELSGSDLKTKLLWANLQYLSYGYSPVTLFAMCAEFTGHDRLVKSRRFLWFAVLPTVIFALVWTDGSFGLIRYGFHLSFSGAVPVVAKQYGPLFYVHAAYSFALNLFSWFLLVRALFSRSAVYRKQTLSLFLGLSLILFPNFLYVSHLIPSYRHDITPALFGPAGLFAAWGIFRQNLFGLVSLAWATVVKNMEVGVLVLDQQGDVLDMNPACEQLLACTAPQAIARPFGEVCAAIPALAAAFSERNGPSVEFSIGAGNAGRVYAAEISPITGKGSKTLGELIMIWDVTEKKRRQQELLDRQWALAVEEERARTARDLHDNLSQILGFVSLQAQGVRYELEQAGISTVSNRLDRLATAAQEAHTELRVYIRGIREPNFERNLFTIIRQDLRFFEERTGIPVTQDFSECQLEGLEPHFLLNVRYIVHEALNNVGKHAAARHVAVSASRSEETLQITVEDDGKGFVQETTAPDGTKFGLGIMRERAEELGGTLEITSKPGKGCRLTLRIPMKGAKRNETVAG